MHVFACCWLAGASVPEKEQACECDRSQRTADCSAANVGGEREEGLHRDIFVRGASVLVVYF